VASWRVDRGRGNKLSKAGTAQRCRVERGCEAAGEAVEGANAGMADIANENGH
jgi:hypothetical protein